MIFEGIMGSGKTTNTLRLADRLNASGRPAIGITEGANPHPIRFDWDVPWHEMRPAQLAASSVACWKTFVDGNPSAIPVVDGQLFHGNMTSLFLLEADVNLMRGYVTEVASVLRPLDALLFYLRQTDIDEAIRTIATERGSAWVQYQVGWKLGSPYAARRGLVGMDGLIALYRDYRTLTDQLFAEVSFPKVAIEDAQRDWERCEAMIDRAIASKDALN